MERNWHYRDETGSEYGPYTREELERYARDGRVSSLGAVAGPDGAWIPATEAGLAFPEATPPAQSSTPPQTSQGAVDQVNATRMAAGNRSPHNRIAYILLGILLPLFVCGLAGVNNLMVGRTGPGAVQLTLALVAMFCNLLGTIIGVTFCIGGPLALGIIIWSIIEAATNQVDGEGRIMV